MDKLLDEAIRQRQAAKAEIKRLTVIAAQMDQIIDGALEVEGKEQVEWFDGTDIWAVFRRKGSEPRKTISPEKLLDAGVPASVIQAATVYGAPGKPGIVVRKVAGRLVDEPDDQVT